MKKLLDCIRKDEIRNQAKLFSPSDYVSGDLCLTLSGMLFSQIFSWWPFLIIQVSTQISPPKDECFDHSLYLMLFPPRATPFHHLVYYGHDNAQYFIYLYIFHPENMIYGREIFSPQYIPLFSAKHFTWYIVSHRYIWIKNVLIGYSTVVY